MKEKLYYSEGKKLMLIHGETIIITVIQIVLLK